MKVSVYSEEPRESSCGENQMREAQLQNESSKELVCYLRLCNLVFLGKGTCDGLSEVLH